MNIIIAGDFNARSSALFDTITNTKNSEITDTYSTSNKSNTGIEIIFIGRCTGSTWI